MSEQNQPDANYLENEKKYIQELGKKARHASYSIRKVNTAQKNNVLLTLADLIDKNRNRIYSQNQLDIQKAKKNSLSSVLLGRLQLAEKEVNSLIESLHQIISLPDPVGEIIEGKNLANGLQLQKTRIPIGSLAVIYESRPNVTIDVAALALKSGNAVILRGGKEAIESNKLLAFLFRQALEKNNLDSNLIQLIENTDRALVPFLLKQKKYIDVVVPRGGASLIEFVTENSSIPVIKHDKGVCHAYVHESALKKQAIEIILNSKIQRPGVCNALETLLIDKNLSFSQELLQALHVAHVKFYADFNSQKILKKWKIEAEPLDDEGYHKEYLDLKLSVKVVENLQEAIEHIREYSSGHSEAIIAQDYQTIQNFESMLDSAALFVNCSTRFHDGGQFAMGAEVGIATGKLHVRGPMGLKDLTTIKYIVRGEGQIRS